MTIDHRVITITITILIELFSSIAVATHVQSLNGLPISSKLTSVPFIGCRSDGQVGPQDPPSATSMDVTLDPAVADQVAYYKADNGPGVLAPRGWFCFGTYGSSGSSLFVSPKPIHGAHFNEPGWNPIPGWGIQISISIGETSGRFAVAAMIARLFPARRHFVDAVIAEGIRPASDFPVGPYPTDLLTRHGDNVVEYMTPPDTKGLGTESLLRPDSNAINGVVILDEDTDLIKLSIRLPPKLDRLTPFVIQQTEAEAQ